MCPSHIARKTITIPTEVYEKLITFKGENEIFSHFSTRIFELFLERSHMAKVDRIGISKRTFNKLIEQYPKDTLTELVQSLEEGIETTLGKKVKQLDLERELAPYLKKLFVELNNSFKGLTFNFLEEQQEFQMLITHTSTEHYADFWASYLTAFFVDRGYSLVERNLKKGYMYLHFKQGK